MTEQGGAGSAGGVSVVIPTWNRAAILGSAIRSALNQSWPPLEVLVCDDGSTDDTREVVARIADARVRWIPGARGGRPAIPRNRGLLEARGEWIAFLDSDDEWHAEKCEAQLARLRQSGRLACCSNAARVVGGRDAGPLLQFTSDVLTFEALAKCNQVVCSSMLLHRSLLPRIAGFPEAKALTALEDYALWLRVSTLTDIDYLTYPLVSYRDDPAASVRADGMDINVQRRAVMTDFLAWCSTQQGERMRTAERIAERHLTLTRCPRLVTWALRVLGIA
ncbi:MAG: glycosyltransferase family 2 protein [Rhodospirillaceae bacterium]